jgi:hypothetical protein
MFIWAMYFLKTIPTRVMRVGIDYYRLTQLFGIIIATKADPRLLNRSPLR